MILCTTTSFQSVCLPGVALENPAPGRSSCWFWKMWRCGQKYKQLKLMVEELYQRRGVIPKNAVIVKKLKLIVAFSMVVTTIWLWHSQRKLIWFELYQKRSNDHGHKLLIDGIPTKMDISIFPVTVEITNRSPFAILPPDGWIPNTFTDANTASTRPYLIRLLQPGSTSVISSLTDFAYYITDDIADAYMTSNLVLLVMYIKRYYIIYIQLVVYII